MFTGIVAAIGQINNITALQGLADQTGVKLTIEAGRLGLDDVALGDSIAIQGACMTVISKQDNSFEVEVSRESLNKTVGLSAKGPVNLEKAVALSTRLGGHLVTGHVDGLGTVKRFEAVGESWLLMIEAQAALAKFLAYKGSITVNGVSLTVNQVQDDAHTNACVFSINLIPHTIEMTTLKHLSVGDAVNLEVDLIARYVERMLSSQASSQ
jgi:riboflavin synthase